MILKNNSWDPVGSVKNFIASLLFKMGLSADGATYLGLFFALLCGILAASGQFYWAGAALFVSGGLDLMDGAIARLAKKTDSFGGILDSTLDRYGDGFIFSGIMFHCFLYQKTTYGLLAISALLGSFVISYVRARSECVISKCKVGFWERGERIVYIGMGMLTGNIAAVLIVLGVGTHMTALYRLFHAYASTRAEGLSGDPQKTSFIKDIFFHSTGRSNGLYAAKVLALTLFLFIYRPIF